MSKVTIELNHAGIDQLLKSQWAMDCCKEIAEEVASRAGEDYHVSTFTGKSRVNASVGPSTYEAYQDNMENNTLLKAIGG